MRFDPRKPHRRSMRLKEFDYTKPGGYFITLVTHRREHLFGEIVDRKMELNDYGLVADECWRAIPEHFPNVKLGAFVVMPNHIHGIIQILLVGARSSLGGHDISCPPKTATTEQFGKPVIGSIPTIVRTYKAAVTLRLGREFNITGIRQRNYHEWVMRDQAGWDRIHRYIEANPSKWAEDRQNPA